MFVRDTSSRSKRKEGASFARKPHGNKPSTLLVLRAFSHRSSYGILNETSVSATTDELVEIAHNFNLKIVTVADLIKYRPPTRKDRQPGRRHLLSRAKYGPAQIYGYKIKYGTGGPIAMVRGSLFRRRSAYASSLFLLHWRPCRLSYGLRLRRSGHMALKKIKRRRRRSYLPFRKEGRGVGLTEKIKAYLICKTMAWTRAKRTLRSVILSIFAIMESESRYSKISVYAKSHDDD